MIVQIHPHAILTIFLPILIFESSFNAHIPILSTNYIQVLTLIGPGVIFTFLVMSFVIKIIIGYSDDDITWWEALTLGSILATTDPVAVVALLKELGAPLHINTLIEMESLFNDGVAMVFFTMFLNMAKGGSATVGEGIVTFLQLAIGGPALGLAWGIGIFILCLFMKKGQSLFLHLIILGCYSVFWVAEKLIFVSGLLAIVFCGIFLNTHMKNRMTLAQEHNVSYPRI